MVRTVLLSEHDLDSWSTSFASGEVPSRLPYGVDVLESVGFELTGVGRGMGAVSTKLRDSVEHRLGYPIERTLRAARPTTRAQLVLALLERQGFFASTLKRAHIAPYSSTPLVIWSCWLADDLRNASPDERRNLVKRVRSADLITHLSRHETEILVDSGLRQDQLFPVTYGVSHHFYTPGSVRRDLEILAVGQDRGRDYSTLFAAVRDTDLTVHLVCKPENLSGLEVPDNVRMHGTVPLSTYRSMLRRARVVAVPTHDLAYPTGSSVALEAAACGAVVVATRTRAMSDLFADEVDALLVDVNDVDGWRNTLTGLHEDPVRRKRLGTAARGNVEQLHNADHMWTEVAHVLTARGIIDS